MCLIQEAIMIDKERLPRHVAVIMDGNGRWAKRKLLPKVAGHNEGSQVLNKIVRKSAEIGIEHLTAYAFSTENWKRSEEEIKGIFSLLSKFIDSELEELKTNGIKLAILGDISKIPNNVEAKVRMALSETENNKRMQVNIALNYGSRAEIVRAVERIIVDKELGLLNNVEISENLISRYLYTGLENNYIPDPDLIIRSSGEKRLSNFLLWQSAYSELVFTDTLWPDFTQEEYVTILKNYSTRERRYGGR